MLATRLLRAVHASPTEIALIDSEPEFGRGAAYAKSDFPFLLNVPAARRDPSIDGKDFLPREIYGDYLQALLLGAERMAPAHVLLNRIVGRAIRITPIYDDRLAVQLDSGISVFADDVVLATGNPAPGALPGDETLRNKATYLRWPRPLPAQHADWSNVLIVGSGLSMADAVMQLTADASRKPYLQIVSRRGLVPLPQDDFQPSALPNGDLLMASATTMGTFTRSIRVFTQAMREAGSDWREVVSFVRSLAPRVWAVIPDKEKRRFARHLQPYWDVHRHCLPPTVAQHIDRLRGDGQMDVSAGRIKSIQPLGQQIKVVWRRRGEHKPDELIVDAVINATGPDYRLSVTQDPLLVSLRDAGLVTADPAGFGLRTDASGALIGVNDKPHPHLHYLGPLLRAEHWEATAVAELRVHIAQLAARLVTRRTNHAAGYERADLNSFSTQA
jgi:uncharacterized NAD(P)/FAD-binding protein YdhS